MTHRTYAVPLLLLFALILGTQPAAAQGLFDRMKDAAQRGAERAVERETAKRADRAVTAAFGLAEDAVVCTVTDETCIEQAQAEGNDVVVVDQNGEPLPADQQPSVQANRAAQSSSAAPAAPGEGVWANYDFVPGERVLYSEGFANDRVGDFPRRLGFVNGNMEIVEWQGQRLLRATSSSELTVPLPEELPSRFTIEFDAHLPHGWHQLALVTGPLNAGSQNMNLFQMDARNYEGAIFTLGGGKFWKSGIRGGSGGTSVVEEAPHATQLLPIRIMVDESYAKMYIGEKRIANVPNADIRRTNELRIAMVGEVSDAKPIYLGNLRVAAGGREMMYDRLMADGRVATQGILFDTGSATIKPESTPTLKDIAQALQQHGDLRLRIEGHTDNTGSADANRQLSERRAAAVRDYLVQRENIDGSRLESAGMGQSVPAADNATPEGRQTNRRVELVVL